MHSNRRRLILAVGIVFVSLLIAILTGVALTRRRESGNNEQLAEPTKTRNPTLSPTVSAASPQETFPTASTELDTPTRWPIQASTSTPTRSPTNAPSANTLTRIPTKTPTTITPSFTPTRRVSTLEECLQNTGIQTIVYPSDTNEYNAARTCLVYEPGVTWQPLAVGQPSTPQEVASVVRCAAAYGVTVSARSGAHSFVAGSCRGHILVDIQNLNGLQVDEGDNIVTFGAGQLHGQLYGKLFQEFNLLLPGGTEAMVGTGGLWLGCGRGMLTQAYGYSCDNLLAVEYVDAQGNLRMADADMLWMAKGGGSLFPGIVTSFTAQAYTAPAMVERSVCYFPNTSNTIRAAVRTFVDHLDFFNDPDNSMFSALIVQRPHIEIDFNCYGCAGTQAAEFVAMREQLMSRVTEMTGGVEAACTTHTYGYGEFLLERATWDTFHTLADLQVRPQWPEWSDAGGTDLKGTAYSGSILVPDGFSFSESLLNEIVLYTETLPGLREERTFKDLFSIYPMKGRGASAIDLQDTAYGGRGAKAVIHFKASDVDQDSLVYKNHVDSFERTLVEVHGLPCQGFYNYQDEDLACAVTDDEYLAAFFSDPARMRRILADHDPDGVFFRLRLQ